MQKLLLISGLLVAASGALAQNAAPSSTLTSTTVVVTAGGGPVLQAIPNMAAAPAVKEKITLAGRVVLPDGKPAAKARLYLCWLINNGECRFHELAADANGTFDVTVKLSPKPMIGMVGVTAFVPGQGLVWRYIDASSRDLMKLDLTLTPGATMTGRLIRKSGAPAANVPLQALAITPGLPPSATNDQAVMQFLPCARFLPDAVTRALFHTTTDASGRFTLAGLPRQGFISLSPGNGMIMASGSANPLALIASDHQPAGILVAVQPGRVRVKVRVLDSVNGTSSSDAPIRLMPASNQLARLTQFSPQGDSGPRFDMSLQGPDAKGNLLSAKLAPGDYKIFVQGMVRNVRVDEGHLSGPIVITMRQGLLKGRLLDANGKPLAKASVFLDLPSTSTEDRMMFQNVGMIPDTPIHEGFNQNGQMQSGRPGAVTAADGTFLIYGFPWGLASVHLHARRGADLAEWSGPTSKIGSILTLKMRPKALIRISGRLIDPQRRPLAKITCESLHWLPTARSTWFATAQPIQADAQGRFHVEGLERGESFSIITTGTGEELNQQAQMEQSPSASPQVVLATNSTVSPFRNFESPRFVTRTEGESQDLGDVMVHPSEQPEQVIQSYGGEGQDPDTIARLNGFIDPPTAADVAEAGLALATYQSALASGDLDALQRLTAHVSPGWSPDRQEFLLNATLHEYDCWATEDAASIRPLMFVPRLTAAFMQRNIPSDFTNSFDLKAGERELQRNPNWVFLTARCAGGVKLAGILHKEEGEWHVVMFPGDQGNNFDRVGLIPGVESTPDPADFSRPAPALEPAEREKAQQAGEQFLGLWAQDHHAAMLAMTAPVSPLYNADLGLFKAGFARRPDEGACPLAVDDKPALQPVDNLSLWDQEQAAGFIRAQNGLVNAMPNGDRDGTEPNALIRRGDTALFQYAVEGRRFLMMLVRYDSKWQMIEPALPL